MTSQTAKYQLVTAESGDASDMPTYTTAAMASVESALDRVLSQANAVANTKVNKAGDTMTGDLTLSGAAALRSFGGIHADGLARLNAGAEVRGTSLKSFNGLDVDGKTQVNGTVFTPGLSPISGQTSAGHSWLVRWDGTGEVKSVPDNTFRLIVAAIGQTSTRRVKTNIAAAKTVPDVTALAPKTYEWTDEAFKSSAPGTRLGLIAEEVAEVDRRLVTVDDQGQPAGLDQHALIAALVAKVTEQQARIEALEAK